MMAVQTRELSRVYKSRDKNPEVVALDQVSMDIPEGEVRGLLGPNGAGKTTLVKVSRHCAPPQRGECLCLGT